MAQPQPQVGKRKVMGRMDIGSSDSSAAALTPTGRPRMLRNAPGSASTSSYSTPTAASARATVASGRAKVDMSAYASSPSTLSTPTMSPPLTRNSSYTRTAAITSPSIGASAAATMRPSTSAGISARTSAGSNVLSSPETRGEDQSFISVRTHRARGSNRSIDFGSHGSLPASPSVAGRPDPTSNGAIHRAPLPRSQTSFNVRASIAAQSPMVRSQARAFGLPQRGESGASRSRSPSPANLEPGRLADRGGQSLAPAYEEPGSVYEAGAVSARLPGSTSPRFLEAPLPDTSMPPLRRRSSLASTASSVAQRSSLANKEAKTASISATVGRTHVRSNSAFQRPSIPKAIMTQQCAQVSSSSPTSPRTSAPPQLLNRTSFASSVESSHDANSGLRSPTSEVSSVSAAVLAEAEGARNNRKLLDLEITNKSLMAINSALEATKLKQAREIRELKRKLREGRGMTMGPDEIAEHVAGLSDEEDGDYFEDADDDGLEEDVELEAAHARCKALIDGMVNRGRQAILSVYKPEDAGLGGKVIHPLELEQRRREEEEDVGSREGEAEGDGDAEADTTHGDASIVLSRSATPKDESGRGRGQDADAPTMDTGTNDGDREPNTSEETDEHHDVSGDASELSHDSSLSMTTPEIEVDSSFVSEEEDDDDNEEEEAEDASGDGRGKLGKTPSRMTRTVPLESSPLRDGLAEAKGGGGGYAAPEHNGDVSID